VRILDRVPHTPAAENRQHQAPGAGACVGLQSRQGSKLGLGIHDTVDDAEQVKSAAGGTKVLVFATPLRPRYRMTEHVGSDGRFAVAEVVEYKRKIACTAEGDVGFWEWVSTLTPSALVAGLLGIGFVLVVFILAAKVISNTTASADVEIVRMRFAQVLFVGIITTLIFASILYLFSPDGPGASIFDKTLTAMTPLAGVVIGYLFGSKTDRITTERKPSDGLTPTVPAPDGAPTSVHNS
jgi:hypothetical protein